MSRDHKGSLVAMLPAISLSLRGQLPENLIPPPQSSVNIQASPAQETALKLTKNHPASPQRIRGEKSVRRRYCWLEDEARLLL